ncbi:MAG: signal peptidase I [Candidatus Liberibacter ctenarytainae]|uniref:Signal peptidase I n=1 Tax=Candidatus Liberibacter ctenarytainae TaxID=2020335 RepID=A0A937AJX3_9HYPH|nr:signal peptidase I [Candidatus Liberibacter ctenarytainae]
MLVKKGLKSKIPVNEAVKSILHAIFWAVLIRTFLFQPSTIPSGSMIPTLLVGDYIIINKFSYGYSKYSLPFSFNLFKGRIFKDQPQRGDVVVFRLPRDTNIDYVKRVIGLPGDKISIREGLLYINDVVVSHHSEGVFSYKYEKEWGDNIPLLREKIDNNVTYQVLLKDIFAYQNNIPDFFVPAGHYFMMGDNRDRSVDSRWIDVGFVPEENLIGRASIVLFSIGGDVPFRKIWLWIPNMRWDRIFKIL